MPCIIQNKSPRVSGFYIFSRHRDPDMAVASGRLANLCSRLLVRTWCVLGFESQAEIERQVFPEAQDKFESN